MAYIPKLLQHIHIIKLHSKQQPQPNLQQFPHHTPPIQNLTLQQKSTQPPKLYNLSTLQPNLNNKYKISPKLLLQTPQTLYHKTILSYPPTQYHYIPLPQPQQL
ncbi:DNA topoisomerase, partial [Bacillus thuringiensis]|uniref:DNA topoisomerase n=1 Tax=Bacillus thuringiensis TaxID=1428 RepID=UPI003D6CD4D3